MFIKEIKRESCLQILSPDIRKLRICLIDLAKHFSSLFIEVWLIDIKSVEKYSK